MSLSFRRLLAIGPVAFALISCGPTKLPPMGGPRLPTVPVVGIVLVDGKPEEGLSINAVPTTPFERKAYEMFTAITGPDGKFEMATYDSIRPDGLPAGEYALTIAWELCNDGRDRSPTTGKCPDKLKDRYATSERAPKKFKVEKGKKSDLGTIELTTQ